MENDTQEVETVRLGDCATNFIEKRKDPPSPKKPLNSLECWENNPVLNHLNSEYHPSTESNIGLDDISPFQPPLFNELLPIKWKKPSTKTTVTVSSVTKAKTTNIQIILSPTKNLTLSPIPTRNKFGPLLRPTKPNSTSTSTIGSSTCSGPLFPPGFEDQIPIHTKATQIKKRKRKMEKKKRLKLIASRNKETSPMHTSSNCFNSIEPDDVITMAKALGLSYKGPISELKEKIEAILNTQKQNWEANNA